MSTTASSATRRAWRLQASWQRVMCRAGQTGDSTSCGGSSTGTMRFARESTLRGAYSLERGLPRELRTSPFRGSGPDLYRLKMQLLGSPQPYDQVEIVSGSVESRRFLALYRRGNELAAAFGVRAAREMIACRRLLELRTTWDEALKQFKATE